MLERAGREASVSVVCFSSSGALIAKDFCVRSRSTVAGLSHPFLAFVVGDGENTLTLLLDNNAPGCWAEAPPGLISALVTVLRL